VKTTGPLLTMLGVLLISGTYMYMLLSHLFNEYPVPLPVKVGIPIVAAGMVVAALPMVWRAARHASGSSS
jgi:hypothetical protein